MNGRDNDGDITPQMRLLIAEGIRLARYALTGNQMQEAASLDIADAVIDWINRVDEEQDRI